MIKALCSYPPTANSTASLVQLPTNYERNVGGGVTYLNQVNEAENSRFLERKVATMPMNNAQTAPNLIAYLISKVC